MTILIIAIKLLHIVSAIGLIVGTIGRNLILARAQRATDMPAVARWVQIGGYFERLLVIPGALVVFGAGLVLAWLQGWPVLGVLQGARINWVLASLLLYLAIYPLIIFVFVPRGKVFAAALDGALAQGHVTDELRAAFRDPAVWLARMAEYAITAAIVYLMVAKPF